MPGGAFDYVIVGAGTAGCVLANRLSADPSVRVALIEAGPSDAHAKIRIPAAVAAAIADPRLGWGYKSAPQRNLNGRQIVLPRGRVLGGCSSINGMAYFRGHPRDFDDWAGCCVTHPARRSPSAMDSGSFRSRCGPTVVARYRWRRPIRAQPR